MKVRVNLPNDVDATSFYRGMGPLGAMERQFEHLKFVYDAPKYNWATLFTDDVLFLQRPYRPDHLQIVQMAKNNGKKIWVDFDDDLFTVPVSNPAYRIYGNEETKKTIARIISHADHVSVSTPQLKRALQERGPQPLNKNVTVVPNAYNSPALDHIYRRFPKKLDRQKIVMWRGSSTHHKDVAEYMDVLVDVINAHKDWSFLFQGDKPWFLYEKLGDNAIFGESLDPIEYFHMIRQLQPRLMIVPLHDSEFNRSKSNIAWIEGAFAGAACLAPDWEEWHRPGILNYSSRETFRDTLEGFLNGRYEADSLVEQSWEFILRDLDIKVVNEKRLQILNALN